MGRYRKVAPQKVPRQPRDIVGRFVEREMAGVEDMDLRIGQVAAIGFRAGQR